MKNRLKGITLIETMLYVGLFSVIIVIIMNFVLSTQEANNRTNNKAVVYQSSQFVTQHLNYTFEKVLNINEENTTFGNNLGTIELEFTDGNKQYYVQDSRLYFDDTPITPQRVLVTSFSLEPIYKDENIIGVQSRIVFVLTKDSNISDTINILSFIR